MNKQIDSNAYFDSLSLAHKLDNYLDGFERNEIHLFSYFAAILFHYSGNPVSEWQYKFVISEVGYPHSKVLDDAIERHWVSGKFEEKGNFFVVTGRGSDELNKLKKYLPSYKTREKYLDAACTTSILIPYKDTKEALLDDPNIKKVKELENQDWISFSNEKLKEITTALGAPADELLIPAISWIKYLLLKNKIKG